METMGADPLENIAAMMPAPEPEKMRKRSPYMLPLPQERVALAVGVTCAPNAFEKLKQGSYADMDNKWDIFYEEPWLYLYRGSGCAVFWVRFEQAGADHRAVEAWMTRDPDVMHSDWIGHLGGDNVDANAAYLMIRLHGQVYRGTGVRPPEALMKRLDKGLPRARKAPPRQDG